MIELTYTQFTFLFIFSLIGITYFIYIVHKWITDSVMYRYNYIRCLGALEQIAGGSLEYWTEKGAPEAGYKYLQSIAKSTVDEVKKK